MKKTLNTSSIMNELQEGSAFFRGNAPTSRAKNDGAEPTKKQGESANVDQNRTVERSNRTDTPNGVTESAAAESTVLTSIDAPQQDSKRLTERYSFEIYTDQKETINDAKYLYYKKTGRKVSSSELIRDALDIFLARLMEKLED